MMLGTPPAGAAPDGEAQYRAFAMRFQQFTSPVAAKGVEDTALLHVQPPRRAERRRRRPRQFGTTVEAFHDATQECAAAVAGNAARDLDARQQAVGGRARADRRDLGASRRVATDRSAAGAAMNRVHKRQVGDQDAPSRNDEYLLYQTLVGTLPAGAIGDAALVAIP